MFDLKKFRKDNRLTQIELANYLNVSQGFVSQVEQGLRPLPDEYISKILADGVYTVPQVVFEENNSSQLTDVNYISIIQSQQKSIENLTEIIKTLAKK